MSRYFVQRRIAHARGGKAEMSIVHSSDDWEPIGNAWHIPAVSDHEASDTGLIDASGDPIMRAPNPMGFVWPPHSAE
ncbi:hypothetical protein M527_06500 [Sphingobium indicum IP26]|uniref:Uncharacterized protein n=1 Tax=Sphingobium indicum F2 TaxID=1450518 RepID=A0A8E0WTZ8_9SPHN|nr:hypothetical protein [Sphingobium indicum]EPR09773.1 hypothetical protein M527_06500 [Sphingobium indicum IP26]KER37276.1 hypothetical protein AL00_06285 [Sphingobium indicum F2]